MIKMIFEVLFLVGVVQTRTHRITEIDTFNQKKIVGGKEVTPKYRYPWMVALLYEGKDNCGGALYNYKTVITASHCIMGLVSDWKASLHRHYIGKGLEVDDGMNYDVIEWFKHPQYNELDYSHDISVWKLATTIKPNNISIQLNHQFIQTPGTTLKVIGWGAIGSQSDASPVLMEISVPIFDPTVCKSIYPTLDPHSQFCAGYKDGGIDSCQGDSGGPIFIENLNEITLVGVVSWGHGCALPNYPGVYTKVSVALDFIQSHSN